MKEDDCEILCQILLYCETSVTNNKIKTILWKRKIHVFDLILLF